MCGRTPTLLDGLFAHLQNFQCRHHRTPPSSFLFVLFFLAMHATRLAVRRIAVSTASRRVTMPRPAVAAAFTTYSGGQPYEGQGGFYGSIKSRSEKNAVFQPGSRAEAEDVEQLQRLMDHWDAEQAVLRSDAEETAAWKELAAEPANVELLKRLVVKGAPAWGLSVEQREFVARFQGAKSA
ncbi:hypothetical protein Poli38472_006608 [Pythium oligandrum]|uniref:Uncharacterized protein n=1 Tax=Pythium oligandrum TaxID=41045 RepID=A0A8K1C550_PYTOL|nr:hypothetical protein Poli38472_006608 [Pythium oligandrum]|eukprot:TMW56598.1 hypothetical protein Poli38472_006608 [Pythium oligandrum]